MIKGNGECEKEVIDLNQQLNSIPIPTFQKLDSKIGFQETRSFVSCLVSNVRESDFDFGDFCRTVESLGVRVLDLGVYQSSNSSPRLFKIFVQLHSMKEALKITSEPVKLDFKLVMIEGEELKKVMVQQIEDRFKVARVISRDESSTLALSKLVKCFAQFGQILFSRVSSKKEFHIKMETKSHLEKALEKLRNSKYFVSVPLAGISKLQIAPHHPQNLGLITQEFGIKSIVQKNSNYEALYGKTKETYGHYQANTNAGGKIVLKHSLSSIDPLKKYSSSISALVKNESIIDDGSTQYSFGMNSKDTTITSAKGSSEMVNFNFEEILRDDVNVLEGVEGEFDKTL